MRRAAWLLALAGCDAASSDPGLAALVRVEGAQFVEGELPAPSGGPAVVSAVLPRANVQVGEVGLALDGTLAPGGNGAAIGLLDGSGYWIVPSGTPDTFDPTHPTIHERVDISRLLPAGTYELGVVALDARGRAGDELGFPLFADDAAVPDGPLVLSLRWNTEADLDLHVVMPDGVEIWRGDVSSYQVPGPGEPPDPPDAWKSGGILDADSNARCEIDGRELENVAWTVAPPSGTYQIRVDAFSMCGVPAAPWVVEARIDGEVVGTASGWATSEDARLPHDVGAGVHALDVDVP